MAEGPTNYPKTAQRLRELADRGVHEAIDTAHEIEHAFDHWLHETAGPDAKKAWDAYSAALAKGREFLERHARGS